MKKGTKKLLLVLLLVHTSLNANELSTRMPELMGSMARFAQPVRVGDLRARYFLAPSEAQHVLGRVAADPVFRTPDGHLLLVIDRGGLLGLGTTRVTIPVEDVAVLGEHVALIGLKPDAFRELPPAALTGNNPVPPDDTIKIAIVGPFH